MTHQEVLKALKRRYGTWQRVAEKAANFSETGRGNLSSVAADLAKIAKHGGSLPITLAQPLGLHTPRRRICVDLPEDTAELIRMRFDRVCAEFGTDRAGLIMGIANGDYLVSKVK